MPGHPLNAAVERFIGDVTVVLTGMVGDLPAPVAAHLDRDVAVEAFNLTLALVDADGRQTDDELWGVLGAFSGRFDTQLAAATPADVRAAGLATGKRAWLDQPSVLFDLIVRADASKRTAHAWTYYDRAMQLGFLVCSLDALPSEDELRALERWRGLLVGAMRGAGVGRPGDPPLVPTRPPAPQPGAGSSGGTPAAATGATAAAPTPPDEPAEPPVPLEKLLTDLDGLVGLAEVKAEVKLVTNLLQVQKLRRDRNLPVVEASRHLVFTGNPGTGKTTVARLLASIYRTLGVVGRGQLVETDRAGLVAGYVGQTALKVTEVFDRADGGVLLIDEAYALARGGERDFGQEAIDTIVKLVEDRRDSVVVIAAGYPDEMADFVDANPGLRSRFPKTIPFADYTNEELVAIFRSLCDKNAYRPTQDAVAAVLAYLAAQPRTKGFGNGRLARNLFEEAIGRQATRLMAAPPPATDPATDPVATPPAPAPSAPTDDQLLALEAVDIPSPAAAAAPAPPAIPAPRAG